MQHYQFEEDLTHLEQIIPQLIKGNPLGLSYWRRRVTALAVYQGLVPDGTSRVTRLIRLFEEIERTTT
ncbi:hypothetical protein B0G62_103221 [Paraburkholderia eburnea]|uniref:Uncharacterized protein n=1 Tax=Paraburkholderia eburnea TaxID=1189126 RepID=A0A2S4MG91_9BURK|nr:hypothetical protein [Paraburkholderia eburnea]POR53649.1 hypothetical protein B0G62_103221 [Paraburkholderia eburnea]PRZ25617.1 hypothetical protein BX588_102221 [Paraburkholderia eburnea]